MSQPTAADAAAAGTPRATPGDVPPPADQRGQSHFAPQTAQNRDSPHDDGPPTPSLEEAFARWQDELLGTLYYLVGNREDARDALQETFVKCWRNRGTLDEIENLKAWIFRVALNTGRDLRASAWRRRRQALVEGGIMLTATQRSPAGDVEQAEELGRVRTALLDLRPEEQEVFLLRQNGGLTYDAIAVAIGIPLGTVKTRMRLAIEKLQLALAGG